MTNKFAVNHENETQTYYSHEVIFQQDLAYAVEV